MKVKFLFFSLFFSFFLNILFLYKYNVFPKIYFRIKHQFLISKAKNEFEKVRPIKPPRIFFISKNIQKEIFPIKLNDCKSKPLPFSLIIDDGCYEVFGKIYDLKDREGLIRIISPQEKISEQRILFKRDIYQLMSSISWLSIHGNRHNGLTQKEKTRIVLTEKLSLTCGYISQFSVNLLKELNIKSRLVWGVVAKNKFRNGYDDGHTMLEVFDILENKWVLFDIDNNRYFKNSSGISLNFIEFWQALKNKKYNLETIRLANDSSIDFSGFISADGYKFGLYSESIMNSISEWYKRVLEVPIIRENNIDFFPDSFQSLFEKGKYKSLKSMENFCGRFYGEYTWGCRV